MKILKIRFSEKLTIIDYEATNDLDGIDEINLKTPDFPLDDFKNCMQSFEQHLKDICNVAHEHIDIRGITFSEKNKKEIVTIIGSTKVGLSNSPFNIVSPNVFNVREETNEFLPNFSYDIQALKDFAVGFINGERRKQEKLFKEPKKRKGKKKNEED